MKDSEHGASEAKDLFVAMEEVCAGSADLVAALQDTTLADHPLVAELRAKLITYDQTDKLFKGSMQAMLVGWARPDGGFQ